MKIDNAIKEFTEKYDSDAMRSIDRISKDIGLNHLGGSMKLINLQESFDKFSLWLEQYAMYKIKTNGNDEATKQTLIKESSEVFMEKELFEEVDVKYSDLPLFVKSYVEGIDKVSKTVDKVKSDMMENDVNLEYIGDVNDFTDAFMQRLSESFDPIMEKILWASGYNSKKKLQNSGKGIKKPVFL